MRKVASFRLAQIRLAIPYVLGYTKLDMGTATLLLRICVCWGFANSYLIPLHTVIEKAGTVSAPTSEKV